MVEIHLLWVHFPLNLFDQLYPQRNRNFTALYHIKIDQNRSNRNAKTEAPSS